RPPPPPSLSSPSLLFVRRPAARLGDVFLLDPIRVELLRARDDLVEGLVVVERRRLREARVVYACDDERLQVRARQAFGLELLDRRAHGIVELEEFLAA